MSQYSRHPLHDACMSGDLERVKDLVDRQRHDINERGSYGSEYWSDTPLHLACRHNHPQVVDFLLNKWHCAVNVSNF